MTEGGAGQARWEAMTAADLDAVAAVADVVHPAFPEDRAVMAERLALHPGGCFVLRRDGEVIGYAISHPWAADSAPPLNTLLGRLPLPGEGAGVHYIHDLALLPAARGTRAGDAAVRLVEAHARTLGLTRMALVAVNNSGSFWQRQGFERVDSPEWAQKLASYGADAAYMTKAL